MKKFLFIPIFFLICTDAFAATRFYFGSSGTAPASPSVGAEWEYSGSTRLPIKTTKRNTTMTEIGTGITYNSTTAARAPNNDIFLYQYISDSLSAQTIAGNVIGEMRAQQSNTLAESQRAVKIWVMAEDGSSRGTLLSDFGATLTTEFNQGVLIGSAYPPSTSLNSVSVQEGDRLVIEIGIRTLSYASGGSRSMSISVGDDSATDLTAGAGEASSFNPWIEFSQNLIFENTDVVNDALLKGGSSIK